MRNISCRYRGLLWKHQQNYRKSYINCALILSANYSISLLKVLVINLPLARSEIAIVVFVSAFSISFLVYVFGFEALSFHSVLYVTSVIVFHL